MSFSYNDTRIEKNSFELLFEMFSVQSYLYNLHSNCGNAKIKYDGLRISKTERT